MRAAEWGTARGLQPWLQSCGHSLAASRKLLLFYKACLDEGLCTSLSSSTDKLCSKLTPKRLGTSVLMPPPAFCPPWRQSWSSLCLTASPHPLATCHPRHAQGHGGHILFTLPAQKEAPGCTGGRVSPPTLKGASRGQLAAAQQGGQRRICPLRTDPRAVLRHNAGFVPGAGTSEGVSDTEKL